MPIIGVIIGGLDFSNLTIKFKERNKFISLIFMLKLLFFNDSCMLLILFNIFSSINIKEKE